MWCEHCNSDVTVDSVAGAVRCQKCGGVFPEPQSPKQSEAIRNARAILNRWQSSDLLDRIQATEKIPPLVWSSDRASNVRATRETVPSPHSAAAAAGPAQQEAAAAVKYKPWQPKRESRTENSTDEPDQKSAIQIESEAPNEQQIQPDAETQLPDPVPQITGDSEIDEAPQPENVDVVETPQSPTAKADEPRQPIFFGVTQLMASPAMHIPEQSPPVESGVKSLSAQQPDSTAAESPDVSTTAGVSTTDEASTQGVVELSADIEHPPIKHPRIDRRYGKLSPETAGTAGMVNVNPRFRTDPPASDEVRQATSSDSLNIEGVVMGRGLGRETGPNSRETGPNESSDGLNTDAVVTGSSGNRIVSNSQPADAVRRFRIDEPESIDQLAEADGQRTRTHGKPRRRYIDEAHQNGIPGPHFAVEPPKRSNLTAMTGQFLAYLGVLGLTIGTAIVIYGHFGGYSEYTPTGWLVTTVAQMLLFLGVINLVSGGIEQTNDDVSRRINSLSEQLVRIEQATDQALRGPKLSPRLYAAEDPELTQNVGTSSGRERATVDL